MESHTPKATEAKAKPVDPWWDLNGTSAGAGTTPNGIWSTSVANWNTNSAGTGALSAWTNGNVAVFSAGSDATGNYTVTVSGSVTASSITFEEGTVTLAGTSTPVLTISGVGGITIASTINGTTTFNSTLGNVVLSLDQNWANNSSQAFNINSGVVASGSTRTLTLNGSGSGGTTFNGVLGDGTGTLALTVNTTGGVTTLANANTYDGATTISGGTVVVKNNTSLGTTTGSTSVASGASLRIDGSGLNMAEVLNTLAGDGGGGGALRNLANNNTWSGAITIANTDARINSDAGVLTLSGAINETGNTTKNLTIGGAGDVTISSAITGGSDLSIIKDGSGTLTFSGGSANTEVSTTVNAGTLKLSKTAGVNAVGGDLFIGDGTGTDTVQLTAANQIANASAVTINSSGVLNLNGNSDTISTLDMTAGSVTTGAGTLTLGGNVTGNANAASATISGNLALGATRTFTIADGAAANDMDISAVISGASFGLTKNGAGTLALSGANTYTGTTTVSGGVLLLNNATALPGGINTAIGAGESALTISGGVVGLGDGNFSRSLGTGAGQVQWTGSGGFAAYGANRSVNLGGASAGVTWSSGSFVPTGSTLILGASGADATVDFQNPISFVNAARTVQVDNGSAAVDAILSGVLSSTTTGGGLTKTGTGTLSLTAANTYTGPTVISGGVLLLNNATALPGGIDTAIGAGESALTISGGVVGLGNGNFSRALGTGAGQVQWTGSGGFAAYGADRSVNLGGASAGVTWNSGSFVLTGSTLILGASSADHTLTFQNPISFVNAARTVQVDDGSAAVDAVLSGVLSSTTTAGGLTKTGAGTLSLTAANTYTGPTAVNAGTLLVNNTSGSGTGTGSVTVNNSGTVLGGTGTISGAVTVNANAKIQGGSGTTGATQKLTLSGNLTLADNSIIQLALGSGGTHSTLARTGAGTWTFDSNQAFTFIDLGATTGTYQDIITGIANPPSENLWTITNSGWVGTFTYDGANIDLNLTAVPEPATWIGGTLALGAIGWSQRRRISRLVRRTA